MSEDTLSYSELPCSQLQLVKFIFVPKISQIQQLLKRGMTVSSQKIDEYAKHLSLLTKQNSYDNATLTSQNQQSTSGPHYEVPNLSSMLYDYTNKEQERVQKGFRIGNFVSIRELPSELLAGNVLKAQQDKIEKNLYSAREQKTYVELQAGGGYFSKFEWKPDSYDSFLEQERDEQFLKKQKQIVVHGNIPFYSQPNKEACLKNQSEFLSFKKDDMSDQVESFMGEVDPYEVNKFEMLRAKWLSDSKMLYGDFKPAKCLKSLKQMTRANLPEAVGVIKRSLLADWSDINFIIGTNPEDYIEMRFDAFTLDSPKGLHAYMNNLVNSNEMLVKYQLRKVPGNWGTTDEDHSNIYYMLAPPWVKNKTPTMYLKQIQQ